ncbi:hypothetical protein GGS23DRAFT_600777 [Durotheca rogersii]|uniref:uncharacterized protein n=1 Tax=Durotheca rogersii TaxID=419775 RepID=UPI00221EB743|nr:uncharacterized protein GGS23DRAFT_600777 [Durotheca rogersii]KAI5857442.1 hypothetical protein GGS23DRAFT_600777 [Durotheca rogersii]
MRPRTLASGSVILAAGLSYAQDETGENPGWPRWCGKVYASGYPSFEPGGHTTEPAPANPDGALNLHVQFKPRHSIYLEGETQGSFVVNAALSPWFGELWTDTTATNEGSTAELAFTISLTSEDGDANAPLVESSIPIDTTGAVFDFSLEGLEPRTSPYTVVFSGRAGNGYNYTATSELRFLPEIAPGHSATKIDNLNGGILFRNEQTGGEFVPLLPYGYYGLYNGSNSTAESEAFVHEYTSGGEGLNAIVSLAGFADTNPVYDSMDASTMRFMFDLRGSYKDLEVVERRVNTIKNHSSLFAYWTADEPDGWQVPFDLPPAAQALIHELDPYHPVAVTLNCQDYYFAEYSSGADILMADPYPIGINTTWTKWGTTCNATLGDCGCDNCVGDGVRDVARRFDDLQRYERWLGRWPLAKFHNPQVFHSDDYWARDPTTGEAFVMNALAFNRGITGIFGWTWPSSQELFDAHSRMAAAVTKPPVSDFLLGGQPVGRILVTVPAGQSVDEELLEGSYWVSGHQVLVSIVNAGTVDINERPTVALPVPVAGIAAVPFGDLAWELQDGQLAIDALPAMSVSFVILDLEER